MTLGARKYPVFDRNAALAWGLAALERDDISIFVTTDCFAVAVTYERFWAPGKRYADLVLIASGRDDRKSAGQLLALARAIREWVVEKGCARLYVDDALAGVDLSPLAGRIGAARQYRGYVVEFPERG